jgi:23S rRNA (cytosine1962-C5)-methyltransferase
MPQPQSTPPLKLGAPHPQGPAAVITRRAADALREGSVWVYRSDVDRLQPAPGATAVPPGALVTVLDSRGIPLGSAIFSSASQITLRLVSATAALTREQYLLQITDRTAAALALRAQLAPVSAEDNAHRLIFSEADQLPGIVADRYNDLILLQLLTQATAQDDVREVLSRALRETLSPATIVERPDPRIRVAEELPFVASESLYANSPEAKLATTFTINGLHFAYDATSGQKTGAFLDQRLNYAAAAHYARSSNARTALDVCTYQGGFALHLAQTCDHVTGVDASRAALEVADANLLLNPQLRAQTNWIEADAFDLLREFESTGKRFDTIVLDPPAFAKSKRATEGALRGYKEMNLRALKMLNPGGTLVTCSCSHHVSLPDFTAILASSAADAHRRVQLLEARGAAPDHPAILTLPETSYLKCLICRVD